ncbi:MAG TPA: hypothetical protein VE759_08825 [Mycobacterium sp.]|nr:hypothetical protein [Mycobacterium sp.]HZA10124.1 hypothetical protein [Mycobacterium sp.]
MASPAGAAAVVGVGLAEAVAVASWAVASSAVASRAVAGRVRADGVVAERGPG